ncbi:MAG: hypothetical protein N3A61_01900 [Ignavibacteria bacterium]|nr:hypothetical protein [Ignavibacteria bacterium]
MSNEFWIAKGKIADLKKQYEDYELRAESLRIQIRELLNPYDSFVNLQLDTILLLVKEFRDLQLKARECLKQIDKIKQEFNL